MDAPRARQGDLLAGGPGVVASIWVCNVCGFMPLYYDQDLTMGASAGSASRAGQEPDQIQAFQDEVNTHSVSEVRFALHQIGTHPLRGNETSTGSTGHGKVKDGQPVAGVRVRHFGGQYHFQITEVSGENFAYDILSMSPESFVGFRAALLDVLRRRA
jgi:hypothetical protein